MGAAFRTHSDILYDKSVVRDEKGTTLHPFYLPSGQISFVYHTFSLTLHWISRYLVPGEGLVNITPPTSGTKHA